jgi:hypothetical protein
LSWNNNFTVFTVFPIERSTEGGAFAPVATVSGNITTTYDDTGLSAGIGNTYEVVAFEGRGRRAPLTGATDGGQIVRGTPHIGRTNLCGP